MKKTLLAALAIITFPNIAHAACTAVSTLPSTDTVLHFKNSNGRSGISNADELQTTSEAGTLFYDATLNAIRVCDGTTWKFLTPSNGYNHDNLSAVNNSSLGAGVLLQGINNDATALKNRRWLISNANEYGGVTGLGFWEYADNNNNGQFCDSGEVCHLRVVFASGGKVGINTQSPTKTLSIYQDANAGIAINGATGASHLDLMENGIVKSNFYWDISSQQTNLNTAGNPMRINGTVGIGKTPDSAYALDVNGVGNYTAIIASSTLNQSKVMVTGYGSGRGYGIHLTTSTAIGTPLLFHNMSGGAVGSVSTDATSTNYATTSDYRLKENVTKITNALSRVKTLKPSQYNFKTTPQKTDEGFIAHEAGEVAPYTVTGIKDAIDEKGQPVYQQMDYGKLTPLLTAAIQELNAKVDALAQENKDLKAKIELIEMRQNY